MSRHQCGGEMRESERQAVRSGLLGRGFRLHWQSPELDLEVWATKGDDVVTFAWASVAETEDEVPAAGSMCAAELPVPLTEPRRCTRLIGANGRHRGEHGDALGSWPQS